MYYHYTLVVSETVALTTKEPVAFDTIFFFILDSYKKSYIDGKAKYPGFVKNLTDIRELTKVDLKAGTSIKRDVPSKIVKMLFKNEIIMFSDEYYEFLYDIGKKHLSLIVKSADYFSPLKLVIDPAVTKGTVVLSFIKKYMGNLCNLEEKPVPSPSEESINTKKLSNLVNNKPIESTPAVALTSKSYISSSELINNAPVENIAIENVIAQKEEVSVTEKEEINTEVEEKVLPTPERMDNLTLLDGMRKKITTLEDN